MKIQITDLHRYVYNGSLFVQSSEKGFSDNTLLAFSPLHVYSILIQQVSENLD